MSHLQPLEVGKPQVVLLILKEVIVTVQVHDRNLIVKVGINVLSHRYKERIVMWNRKCVSENNDIHSITSNHVLVNHLFYILELVSQIIVEGSSISDSSAQQGEPEIQGSFVDKVKVFGLNGMAHNLERVIPVFVKLMEICPPEALCFYMIGAVIPFVVYGQRYR